MYPDRRSVAGWSTNEGLIISILVHRSYAQRRQKREAYADVFGEDILKALDEELMHAFENVVRLWVLDPVERDAVLAYESAKRWGPGDRALIEIACARSSEEIFEVRRAYHSRYKRSVEEDVAANAKGDFRKDLKSDPKEEFLSALRAITKCITYQEKYFKKTIRLAINKMRTEEGAVTRVITTHAKVKLIKELYFKRNGMPLVHAIKKDTTLDYEDFLVAIVGEESA